MDEVTWLGIWVLLHTWAKSCDHGIVRAQTKCSKVVFKPFQKHVVWSQVLKCSVKSYVIGPQPNVISMNFIHAESSHMIKYITKSTVFMRFWSAMVSRFCARVASKRGFLYIVQVTHETRSIWGHVGFHVDFKSTCTHTLRWSLKCSVNWTATGSTLSTNESAWSAMDTGPQSRVWSGPKYMYVTKGHFMLGAGSWASQKFNNLVQ